jgi:hypothetical protein
MTVFSYDNDLEIEVATRHPTPTINDGGKDLERTLQFYM